MGFLFASAKSIFNFTFSKWYTRTLRYVNLGIISPIFDRLATFWVQFCPINCPFGTAEVPLGISVRGLNENLKIL